MRLLARKSRRAGCYVFSLVISLGLLLSYMNLPLYWKVLSSGPVCQFDEDSKVPEEKSIRFIDDETFVRGTVHRNSREGPEDFSLSPEPFKPLSIPIVIFSNYRYSYLQRLVRSLENASSDIEKSTPCIFVLDRHDLVTTENISKTLNLVNSCGFCKSAVWEHNSTGTPHARKLLNHWWSVVERIFSSGQNGTSYEGDVLFLEEDIELSPDAFKVLWFLLRVKNTFATNIVHVTLGNNSGGNLINAHPDTVVVRITHYLQAMAYAFNRTFWEALQREKKQILEGERIDFTEAIGVYFLHKENSTTDYFIAAPTLSRVWHIGRIGLGTGGNYKGVRPVSPRSPWSHSPRLINLETAKVSRGIRDIFGYYCTDDQWSYRIFGPDKKTLHCTDSLKMHFVFFLFGENTIQCDKNPLVDDECILDTMLRRS